MSSIDPVADNQIRLLRAQLARAYAGFELHLGPLRDRIAVRNLLHGEWNHARVGAILALAKA